MVFDGALAHHQRLGDRQIGVAAREQAQHLELAGGERLDEAGVAAPSPRAHQPGGVLQLAQPGAHPMHRGAQLGAVQLERVAQHRALEHAGELLRVSAHDVAVERVDGATAAGGIGVQQPDRVPADRQGRDRVGVPAQGPGQRGGRPSAGRGHRHDLSHVLPGHLVLEQRVLEAHLGLAQLGECGVGLLRIGPVPDRQRDDPPVYDLADHHPVELGSGAELGGRAGEQALGRAQFAQSSRRLGHALQRVRPPHVVKLDQLPLQREQVHQRALGVGHVEGGRGRHQPTPARLERRGPAASGVRSGWRRGGSARSGPGPPGRPRTGRTAGRPARSDATPTGRPPPTSGRAPCRRTPVATGRRRR